MKEAEVVRAWQRAAVIPSTAQEASREVGDR
jgi:hypothetical protein